VKLPDVTMDHVLRLDREVCFLLHFVQLERRALGRLQEGLLLLLMVVEEDQEDISCQARRVPKRHSEAKLTNLTQKITNVCDLLTWPDSLRFCTKHL